MGTAASNTGRKRHHNEDAFVYDPPLFAVADGMGGARAGEVASSLAASALREASLAATDGPESLVVELIQGANRRVHERALNDLTAIAGQKAVATRAKKAIATFKIREGLAIGAKVTLRGDLMYEFIDRLITMALPRVRDFRGVNPKSFDGRGNYAMGLKEHIVFLEIDYDKTETVWGMDIILNTSAKTDEEAKALLEGFQFPFTH